MRKLKVQGKKRDDEHEKHKQKEKRRIITRRIIMPSIRASRLKKYSDNDILLDTGSTCSVFKK